MNTRTVPRMAPAPVMVGASRGEYGGTGGGYSGQQYSGQVRSGDPFGVNSFISSATSAVSSAVGGLAYGGGLGAHLIPFIVPFFTAGVGDVIVAALQHPVVWPYIPHFMRLLGVGMITKEGGTFKTWKVRLMRFNGPSFDYYDTADNVLTRTGGELFLTVFVCSLADGQGLDSRRSDHWRRTAAGPVASLLV